jgi:hypothetical protein
LVFLLYYEGTDGDDGDDNDDNDGYPPNKQKIIPYFMYGKEKTLYDGRLGFYNDEQRSNLR